MELNYKLTKVKDLADGDQEFIRAMAAAFVEEVLGLF